MELNLNELYSNELYSNWPITEFPFGWAGEVSILNPIHNYQQRQLYNDVIKWIYANIDNPHRNAHWFNMGSSVCVRIRKKEDLLWLKLAFKV